MNQFKVKVIQLIESKLRTNQYVMIIKMNDLGVEMAIKVDEVWKP